jgi:hypothetical protein
MKNLEDLKQILASMEQEKNLAIKRLEECKAVQSSDDHMKNMRNEFYDSMSRMWNYAYQIQSSFYNYASEHAKGHLPPIKTASQMEKCLKSMGMENDYQVYKPVLSVANTKRGNILEANVEKN